MKKKLLLTLLTAACALCGTFAFTGCNQGDGTDNAPATTGTPTAPEKPTTPEKREKMSETDWKAALDKSAFTNFTATMSDGEYVYTVKADLGNGKFCDREGESTDFTYYQKDGDKYYRYEFSGSAAKYIRREDTEFNFDNNLFNGETLLLVLDLNESYSHFAYDKENDKYTCGKITVNEYLEIEGAELKFTDGKVVSANIDFGEDSRLIFGFVYGGVTVTIPKDYVTENEKEPAIKSEVLSESEWKAALNIEAFDNYTAISYAQGQKDETAATVSFNDGILFMDEDGETLYYAKDGDKYYRYTKGEKDEKFVKETISQTHYEISLTAYISMFLRLADSYSLYTYDAEQGVYLAENTAIGTNMTGDVTLKFEGGKLVYYSGDIGDGNVIVFEIVYGDADNVLPKDYVTVNEKEPAGKDEEQTVDLAGNTFVFYDIVSDEFEISDSMLAQMKNGVKNQIFAFNEDGTLLVTQGEWFREELTYEVDGNTVTATITSANVYGKDYPDMVGVTTEMYLDGEGFYTFGTMVNYGKYKIFFRLQTEE
ncbi:MAG: hypothetical protein NC131_01425 [Roseburia sp.]|nr:hypothetical protein [Roseburia sp.]